jgi:hypothetical protein
MLESNWRFMKYQERAAKFCGIFKRCELKFELRQSLTGMFLQCFVEDEGKISLFLWLLAIFLKQTFLNTCKETLRWKSVENFYREMLLKVVKRLIQENLQNYINTKNYFW